MTTTRRSTLAAIGGLGPLSVTGTALAIGELEDDDDDNETDDYDNDTDDTDDDNETDDCRPFPDRLRSAPEMAIYEL